MFITITTGWFESLRHTVTAFKAGTNRLKMCGYLCRSASYWFETKATLNKSPDLPHLRSSISFL